MIEAANPELTGPTVTTSGDHLPVLEGVHIATTVNGFVMTSAISQTYRNNSDDEIEVTYTFPLPTDAVLTDLKITINGKTLNAQVLPKKTAERDYEAAIESGDTLSWCKLAGLGSTKPASVTFCPVNGWSSTFTVHNPCRK